MGVSLTDVARRARVSTAAVSKALRDMNDISPETRKRIKRIAGEMGYTINIAARTLATRKTMMIGVVVSYPHIPTVIERLRGIQTVATDADYAVSVAFHEGEIADEIRQLELLQGRVDGIILTPSRSSEKLVQRVTGFTVPLVCMSETIPDMAIDFSGIDDTEGGRLAARHLIELGRRSIAYLGDTPETPSDQAILQGLNQILGEADLVLQEAHILWGNTKMSRTIANVDRLLTCKEQPTAIFACSDMAAIWALKRLREQGLVVPDNMALVGFDDIEFAQLVEVPITTIAQPNYEIGHQAATLMLERLRGGVKKMTPRRVIFPCRLVVRESSRKN